MPSPTYPLSVLHYSCGEVLGEKQDTICGVVALPRQVNIFGW